MPTQQRRCVAPTCHRTRPRKKKGQRRPASKCVRPSPWNALRTRLSGQGYSMAELSGMYNQWKRQWADNHPGMSTDESRARMNEFLCQEIDDDNRLARVRGPRWAALDASREQRLYFSRLRARRNRPFFVANPVPNNWSVETHINNMTFPYVFTHADFRNKTKTINMTKADVERLLDEEWYNDEIMNAYMMLLGGEDNPGSDSSVFMPSFLYTKFAINNSGPLKTRHRQVERWTKDVETTKAVKIFVPINIRNKHWIMVLVDVGQKRIVSMDSMCHKTEEQHQGRRNKLLDWIQAEHMSKNKPFDRKEWIHTYSNVPQQGNGVDCGPFSCMFAAFASNNKKMAFSQADLPRVRKHIAYSILRTQL